VSSAKDFAALDISSAVTLFIASHISFGEVVTCSVALEEYHCKSEPWSASTELIASQRASFEALRFSSVKSPLATALSSQRMASFALAIFCPKWWQKILCLLIAILGGYSRIYLSQHFIEDVLAGSVIGIISVLILIPLVNKLKEYNKTT
jgi:hypothetical protein